MNFLYHVVLELWHTCAEINRPRNLYLWPFASYDVAEVTKLNKTPSRKAKRPLEIHVSAPSAGSLESNIICGLVSNVCRATDRRCSFRSRPPGTRNAPTWRRSVRRPTSRRCCISRRTRNWSPTRTVSSSTPSSASVSSRRWAATSPPSSRRSAAAKCPSSASTYRQVCW